MARTNLVFLSRVLYRFLILQLMQHLSPSVIDNHGPLLSNQAVGAFFRHGEP